MEETSAAPVMAAIRATRVVENVSMLMHLEVLSHGECYPVTPPLDVHSLVLIHLGDGFEDKLEVRPAKLDVPIACIRRTVLSALELALGVELLALYI